MDVAVENTTLLIHEPCNTISSFRYFDENLDTTASPTADFNLAMSLLSFGSAFFHGSSCSNGVANDFDVLGIRMVMVSDGTMVPVKLKFGWHNPYLPNSMALPLESHRCPVLRSIAVPSCLRMLFGRPW
jgi:hypothetical protein